MDEAAAVAVFDKDVGEWDATMEIVPFPGAPPVVQRGHYSNRILGGRWLVVEWRTEEGFEGHGVYGWNPAKQRYTGVWVDSMQSGIATSEGTWDADRRAMTYDTTAQGRTGPVRYREVTVLRADGALEYTNTIALPGGAEHVMIRTVSRRSS